MRFTRTQLRLFLLVLVSAAAATGQSSSSHSSQASRRAASDSSLDPGSVSDNLYRNKTFGFTCRIPDGWVLRTDEMNARDEDNNADPADQSAASSTGAKVLLAAFSRPPAAKGEEVNSSILIAAESAGAYPGLKEAAQYFYPLTEVAKSQGFLPDEDPYDVAIGTKTLTRGDFHKDVGTRVMRQSTLAMLSHGYAISITVIAGTDDDVEDLIDGLDFEGSSPHKKPASK
jgi:hypothetical protein